jgi:hypothetical protein
MKAAVLAALYELNSPFRVEEVSLDEQVTRKYWSKW